MRARHAERSTGILPLGPTGVSPGASKTRWARRPQAPQPRRLCYRELRRRHALPIEVNFANPFDSREYVIGRLAPHAHQLGPDNSRHEIARQIENVLWGRAFKSFAKNRSHRARKSLHFRAKRHANMRFSIFIDVQVNADGISTFLVLADILQVELLARTRFLFSCVVSVGNEGFTPLIFRERFEKIDDVIQFWRVRRHTLI
jgi:hypothetical protein